MAAGMLGIETGDGDRGRREVVRTHRLTQRIFRGVMLVGLSRDVRTQMQRRFLVEHGGSASWVEQLTRNLNYQVQAGISVRGDRSRKPRRDDETDKGTER